MAALRFLLAFSLLSSGMAHPAPCPKDNSIMGYADWDMLQLDVSRINAQSALEDATFTICPETTFWMAWLEEGNQGLRFNVPSAVHAPPITIRCGLEGSSTDECMIQGGMHHVWIQEVGALTFEGMTFDGATRGSVWTGTASNQIAFKDCIFQNNVYNWNPPTPLGGDAPDRCPTGCYGAVGGEEGATSFEKCQFLNNEGDSGAVYGLNMAYSFAGCLFVDNKSMERNLAEGTPTGSAITLHDPLSSLYLSNTCFENNTAMGPATVMLEDATLMGRSGSSGATSLRVNTNNFFKGNVVAQPNLDYQWQYCHNSIYNFVRGNEGDFTFDDCVPGQATCCMCEEGSDTPTFDTEVDVTRKEGLDLGSGLEEEETSSAYNSRTRIVGLLVSVAGWMMV